MKRYGMHPVSRCGETFDELQEDDSGEWVRFEDVEQALGDGSYERSAFIRQAAAVIAAAVDGKGVRAFTPAECWDRAVALWNLKPEGV